MWIYLRPEEGVSLMSSEFPGKLVITSEGRSPASWASETNGTWLRAHYPGTLVPWLNVDESSCANLTRWWSLRNEELGLESPSDLEGRDLEFPFRLVSARLGGADQPDRLLVGLTVRHHWKNGSVWAVTVQSSSFRVSSRVPWKRTLPRGVTTLLEGYNPFSRKMKAPPSRFARLLRERF